MCDQLPKSARLRSVVVAALLASALAVQAPTGAVDASDGVVGPNVEIEPAESTAVLSATVLLRDKTVQLTWKLNVQPGHSARASFTGQRFRWRGEADPYPERQFPELEVLLDGAPALTTSRFSAWMKSTEISNQIRAAGLDPFVITESPPIVAPPGALSEPLKALEREGAIVPDDAGYLAKWSAQRIVSVPLAPGSQRQLTLKYTARPAFALQSFSTLASGIALSKYCVTKSQLSQLLAAAARRYPIQVNEYAVPSAINNTPPPELSVDIGGLELEGQPVTIAIVCKPNGEFAVVRGQGELQVRPDARGTLHLLALRVAQR
jgi:hypothetical protein